MARLKSTNTSLNKSLNKPSLLVKNLNHKFGATEILQNIEFSLEQGKVTSVVGPSGSGKTTLLHLCGGLLDITDGKVINSFSSQAFAFQDARLLPWQTALSNIAFGLKGQGVSKKIRNNLATKMALKLGLDKEDLNKFPKDLSGGMRQRVSFARALVIKPQLMFLDEPFSALDIGLKQELKYLLMDLVSKEGLTVFFITHDLTEAIQLSDEIMVMEADPGRIIKRIILDTPQLKRDDDYIFKATRDLLQDPQIIATFELNIVKK